MQLQPEQALPVLLAHPVATDTVDNRKLATPMPSCLPQPRQPVSVPAAIALTTTRRARATMRLGACGPTLNRSAPENLATLAFALTLSKRHRARLQQTALGRSCSLANLALQLTIQSMVTRMATPTVLPAKQRKSLRKKSKRKSSIRRPMVEYGAWVERSRVANRLLVPVRAAVGATHVCLTLPKI